MQTAKWEGARLAAQGPGAAGPGQQGGLVLHVPTGGPGTLSSWARPAGGCMLRVPTGGPGTLSSWARLAVGLVLRVPILSTLSQSCPAFASQQRLKLCS